MKRIACLLISASPLTASASPLGSLESLAEACGRFAPLIALREGEAIFLDITGTHGLYSENGLTQRLIILAQRFGYKAQIGFSDTAAYALTSARYPRLKNLPLAALHDLASPFRADPELSKQINKACEKLVTLGITDLEGFLNLPRQSFSGRFGKEIHELSLRARGELESAWPEFKPAGKIVIKTEIDETIGLDPLFFTLRAVVDPLMARLRGRSERLAAFQLEFELVKWSTLKSSSRDWKIHLSIPQGSTAGLLAILRERLHFDVSREPFEAPVQAVSVTVLETAPGIGAQRDFYHQREEESESWNALLGRLSHALGEENVFQASSTEKHRPENAWTKAKIKNPVKVPIKNRPTRVLKNPVLIHMPETWWRSIQWAGPERISGDWWEGDSGFDRDYFQVMTPDGEKLWIYADRTKPDHYFLHGYFD